MAQEFTLHTNAKGNLSLELGTDWADTEVKVTVETVSEQTNHSPSPKANFAEALRRKAGGCSFEVPKDIHQRKSEIFADILMEKHQKIIGRRPAFGHRSLEWSEKGDRCLDWV